MIGQTKLSLKSTVQKQRPTNRTFYHITSSGLSTALSTDLDPSSLIVILSRTRLPSGLTVSVVVTVPGVTNAGSSSSVFAGGIFQQTPAHIANRTLAARANPAPMLNIHPSSHAQEEK
mmetsp:Transcript_5212/g.14777  ORF Transcript_5212/g.14777 Transcript_5212/m.14777 type:complete len:118 (-) Transcript_5212:543-896(-)